MATRTFATGAVDLVLPLDQVAATAPRITLPAAGEELETGERQLLQKIVAQVRARTGRDFSQYKRAKVLRRIGTT